ncbi:N-6 DNA methylase [Enterococcus faecalis]|uniref:N-6 DNA methylase n=1 Tax=Enterococcus TaxID=1350 RepID=UPI00210EBE9A|nr:N-6 DNA methylase [Enterococcus faecalis]MDN3177369.1 N-6 DNA methylase [Enterococcus faecalis]
MSFLLFNLATRNINAIVLHGVSLCREFKAIYRLKKSSKFSEIEEIPIGKSETVIMNPPYSLPWDPAKEYLEQKMFSDYGVLAPKSKSDYAFLLQGVH